MAGKAMGMDGGKFRPGAAQLILSGSVLTLFLVVHVKQFRLGHPAVPGDVHTLARLTLADPKTVAGYIAGVAALGFHLWKGWSSVLFSLKLEKEHLANGLIIGRVVVRCDTINQTITQSHNLVDRMAVESTICALHSVCPEGTIEPIQNAKGYVCVCAC